MNSTQIIQTLARRGPKRTPTGLPSNAPHISHRSMGFRPRRTPPPSLAGVNLSPRPIPITEKLASQSAPPSITQRTKRAPPPPTSEEESTYTHPHYPGYSGYFPGYIASPPTDSTPSKITGGKGRAPDWVSPHHKDYFNRIDGSTLNHPELLHGDPHMPISRLARGNTVTIADKDGRVKEIDNYRDLENLPQMLLDLDTSHKNDAIVNGHKEEGWDESDDGMDDLDKEYGPSVAEAIRAHLYQTHTKHANVKEGKDGKWVHSPLDRIEQEFRIIDRLTAATGSTQDLALDRRAKTESRDYDRLGKIAKWDEMDGGDWEDVDDDDEVTGINADGDKREGEFGRGRGYTPRDVFGRNATVTNPYGPQTPSPSYHPDFMDTDWAENPNDPDEEDWMRELNKLVYEEQYRDMNLGDGSETMEYANIQEEDMEEYMKEKKRTAKYDMRARENEAEMDREEKLDELLEMIKRGDDPNQEAFGPWGECVVKVDRVQKVERGGTTVRYRALVIGGNGNGAAGFGIGKASEPNESIVKAAKHCKRNVFYINRYLNQGLTYDLAGKHNSCRVAIRATRPDFGLHGHPLICEILKHAGITDATCKSHGNRNPYNVVYATFKALQTHESLEDIALKRGKKFLNIERARRLGI